MDRTFGWDYPPGVTGNEPQITGEWPCQECDGQGYDEDEDGKHACPRCKGSGVEPEDAPCLACGAYGEHEQGCTLGDEDTSRS